MLNKNILKIIISLLLIAPFPAAALFMPSSGNDLAEMAGLDAQAYVVTDAVTGAVLISKNPDMQWTPASLTKLVTAMVVLDTKTKLTKAVAMTSQDQVAGWCKSGGVCIKSKAGVKFTVDGLFHAALMPSANNAANALARSTGFSQAEFVARMNAKAASLGATGSHFNEPTGMDPTNKITAGDYAKILTAAFDSSYLSGIAGLTNYNLRSANNSGYNQTIKNNDKLLSNVNLTVLGAKTGYLNESLYNFSALLKTQTGQKLAIVVLGENHLYTAFAETALLASLADEAQYFALRSAPVVLGTSTVASIP